MLAHAAAMRRDVLQQCYGTDLSRALTFSEVVNSHAVNATHNTLPNAAYRWCLKRKSTQEITSGTPVVMCVACATAYHTVWHMAQTYATEAWPH